MPQRVQECSLVARDANSIENDLYLVRSVSLFAEAYPVTTMSCFFQSVGALLRLDAAQVRNQIVDCMIADADKDLHGMRAQEWVVLSSEVPCDTFVAYTARMRCASTWGGALECAYACALYRVQIWIHGSDGRWMQFGNPRAPKTLYIKYTGTHYTPLALT